MVREEGGRLVPTFNVRDVEVPEGFKPGLDILAQKASGSLFERILDLLLTSGISREEALALIDEKEKAYGRLTNARGCRIDHR